MYKLLDVPGSSSDRNALRQLAVEKAVCFAKIYVIVLFVSIQAGQILRSFEHCRKGSK